MRRTLHLVMPFLLAVAIVGLSGCGLAAQDGDTGPETPPAEQPAEQPTEPPAAGLRLAPGLYELEDGTAQAVGTLAYRDVEGGFWVIVGRTEAEGTEDDTIAVIANGDYFQRRLEPLKGKQVMVTGTKVEGASIRMAGPEIEIDSVEEITDTPGIAE